MAPRFERPSPYPGSRPVVELDGRHLHGSFNLIGIGITLASEGIASREAPPAFLEIEPACALGNEGVLEARGGSRPACAPGALLIHLALLAHGPVRASLCSTFYSLLFLAQPQ
jgi:hypothetical protein